jgi:hypothetical protein
MNYSQAKINLGRERKKRERERDLVVQFSARSFGSRVNQNSFFFSAAVKVLQLSGGGVRQKKIIKSASKPLLIARRK